MKFSIKKIIIDHAKESDLDKFWNRIYKKASKSSECDKETVEKANSIFKKMTLDQKKEFALKCVSKIKEKSPKKYDKLVDAVDDYAENKVPGELNEAMDIRSKAVIVGSLADIGTYILSMVLFLMLGIGGLIPWAIAFVVSAVVGNKTF